MFLTCIQTQSPSLIFLVPLILTQLVTCNKKFKMDTTFTFSWLLWLSCVSLSSAAMNSLLVQPEKYLLSHYTILGILQNSVVKESPKTSYECIDIPSRGMPFQGHALLGACYKWCHSIRMPYIYISLFMSTSRHLLMFGWQTLFEVEMGFWDCIDVWPVHKNQLQELVSHIICEETVNVKAHQLAWLASDPSQCGVGGVA